MTIRLKNVLLGAVMIIWLYMLVMPYLPREFYSVTNYDYRRVLTLLICLLLNIGMLFSKEIQSTIFGAYHCLPKFVRVLIWLFFLIGVLSSLINSDFTANALMQVGFYWMLLVLGLYLAGMLMSKGSNHYFVYAFITIMCLCYGVLVFYELALLLHWQTLNPDADYNIKAMIAYPTFVNIRFLTQYISWVLPLLSLCYFQAGNYRLFKSLCFIALVMFWYLAIASSSRVFVIEYTILILVLALLNWQTLKKYLTLNVITFILGYVLFILVQYLVATEVAETVAGRDFSHDQQRSLLWHAGVQGMITHPVLGVGPLQYPAYIFNHINFAAHPHNFYLQMLSEWGVLAGGLFIFLVLYGVVRFFRFAQQSASMIDTCLLASMVCGLVHAAFSGVFVMPLGQVTAVVVFALAFSRYYAASFSITEDIGMTVNRQSLGLFMVTAFAGTMLILVAHKQMLHYEGYINNYYHYCKLRNKRTFYQPNFWSIGWSNLYGQLDKGEPFACYQNPRLSERR